MSTNKKPGRKPGVSSFIEMTLAELAEVYGPQDKVRVSLVQFNKVRDKLHTEATQAVAPETDEPEVPVVPPAVEVPVVGSPEVAPEQNPDDDEF